MTAAVFVTDTGVAVPAVTSDQMREIDRVAIEEVGPNLFQMMENAGRSLAQTVIEWLADTWSTSPVVVLAGKGGNGGGGICAARHLANHGVDVTVISPASGDLAPVTGQQLELYLATGSRLGVPGDLGGLEAELVVDSIIGYSLTGAPTGSTLEMIDWAGSQPAQVIALDVPSGLDATTGIAPGSFLRASTTLTLALPKTGLDTESVGDLHLADIGIPSQVYQRVGINVPSDIFGARYRVPLNLV